MSYNNQKYSISEFYCTSCGQKGIPIIRRNGFQRKAGHLKKLYCCTCKKETNFAEIRPFGKYTYEQFKKEFDLGRFVEGKRVSIQDLKNCKNEQCKCCENGKCWNANHSNKCLLDKGEI